ncbi:hypothetical protein F2Q70_00023896 [Brassica cretica]|uniref:Uncharacterized protein n=1 Tax=Brassica cretica TaxID=69181 RepID=A0A8S9GHK0_BRACR|nr:hypothetical protein F2Q70_00023896 [Brassica cretica]
MDSFTASQPPFSSPARLGPVASKAPHVDPSSDAVSGEIVATDPISKAAQTVAGSSLTKAIQVDEIGQITGTGNIVEASQAAITASLTGFKSPPTNQPRQDHVYTVDIGNGKLFGDLTPEGLITNGQNFTHSSGSSSELESLSLKMKMILTRGMINS